MAGIALTEAQRTNIATLRDIQTLSDRTQERLSSGRKVNDVVDDATAYFTSQALNNRAEDILVRKDYIDQGISTLQSSLDAIEAINSVLDQMKGITESAKSQTTLERLSATTQFNELGTQVSQLVEDSSYNGYNLISDTNNELDIRFSDRTASAVTIGGFDFNSTTAEASKVLFTTVAFSSTGKFAGMSLFLGGSNKTFTTLGENNSAISLAEAVISVVDGAVERLRAAASELGANVSFLQTRSDFSDSYASTLATGADKLTLADMNEEGANLTALQTRQQLGIQSLAISGDQAASVLTLVQ